MPRRLPKPRLALCIISLLLCIVFATLWLRSLYFRTQLAWHAAPEFADSIADTTHLEFNNGLLHLHTVRHGVAGRHHHGFNIHDIPFSDPYEEQSRSRWQWTSAPNGWSFAGFAHASSGDPSSTRSATTTIPLYIFTLLFAIGPAIALRRHLRRRHRARNNLCPSCGYDLRASPGKCPECGTPATGAVGRLDAPAR